MSEADIHAGFDFSNRVALYLEGQLCAFTQASIAMQDGAVPTLSFSVPATEEARLIGPRVHVHLLVREPVKDEWVVMFEGEIIQRGFQKSAESRELSFVAHHVSAYYEQFSITSLSLQEKIDAALKLVKELQQVFIGTVTGNVMNYFNREEVVKIYNSVHGAKKGMIKVEDVTLPIYIESCARLYQKLFDEHWIKNSYPPKAVKRHRLVDRLLVPDQMAFNWNNYYNGYMQGVLMGLKDLGGRISFMDFMRYVGANFLHQVTVIPHAESFRKQIQFKPHTIFNIVPPCNVVYPCLSDGFSFQEDYASRPTRMEASFQPIYDVSGEVSNALPIQFTVFAPNELNFLWRQVVKMKQGASQDGIAAPVATNATPSPGSARQVIDFITHEEETRGIVAAYYELPYAMSVALDAKLKGNAAEQKKVEEFNTEDPTGQARTTLYSESADDRRIRYKAFLCTVLGDNKGVKTTSPGILKQDNDELKKFRRRGFDLFKVLKDKDVNFWTESPTSGRRYIRPKRIVLMPLNIPVVVTDKVAVSADKQPFRALTREATQDVYESQVNFFIDKDGNIIQVWPRWRTLFAQPDGVPFGVRVKGLSASDAKNLNAHILPLGKSREAKRKYSTAEMAARGTPRTKFTTPTYRETLENLLARTQIGESAAKPISVSSKKTVGGREFTNVWLVKKPGGGRFMRDFIKFKDGNATRNGSRYLKDQDWANISEGDSVQISYIRSITKEAQGESTEAFADELLWQPSNPDSTKPAGNALKIKAGDLRAVIRNVKILTDPDEEGTQYLAIEVDKPIFDRAGFFHAVFTCQGSSSARTSLAKPWVVMSAEEERKSQSGVPFSAPPVEMDALNKTGSDSSISKDSLIGGPVGAVAIALQSTDGSVTSKQANAAAWLCGVLMELTVEDVGTLKSPTSDYRARQKDGVSLTPDQIHEVADYFVGPQFAVLKVNGKKLVDHIRAKSPVTRGHLFDSFNLIDKAINEGKDVVVNMSDDNLIQDDADRTVEDIQGVERGQQSSAEISANNVITRTRNLSEIPKVTDAEVQSMDQVSLKLVAQIVNYQFYNIRYASQSFSTNMSFNPYLIHGYPALILDNSDSRFHLMAYCYGITHNFTPASVTTSATFTHVRPATGKDLMIPFNKAPEKGQAHWFNLKKDRGKSVEFGSQAHANMLQKMDLWVHANDPFCVFPVELLNWYTGAEMLEASEKLPPHVPTAFVYDGGFGMSSSSKGALAGDPKSVARYDGYLTFTGYVDGKSKVPLREKLAVDQTFGNFVYADSKVITAGKSLVVDDSTPLNSAPLAYKMIYRPIQKANKVDPRKGRCSTVVFAKDGFLLDEKGEIVLDEKGKPKEQSIRLASLDSPPESIFVVSSDHPSPEKIFDENGSIKIALEDFKKIYVEDGGKAGLGGRFKWSSATSERVSKHTSVCRDHKALRG